MKALKWCDRKLEETVCVYLFMIFSGIMVVNVFMRFVMHNAIPWASDLVLFIFIWFVWFAISYGFKKNAHVNVTFVVDLLPPGAKKVFAIISNLLVLVGFAVLFYAAAQLLTNRSVVGKTGLLIPYPMWSLYLATPVGLALSIIRIIQNSAKLLKPASAETTEGAA